MIRATLAALLVALPAAAEEPGAPAFAARCASCHAVTPDAPSGPGPTLYGLIGRRIAGDPGFDYSPVLRAAEGVWDEARLDAFLADPEEMFPGLWMGNNGVRDTKARAAIVRYLAALR